MLDTTSLDNMLSARAEPKKRPKVVSPFVLTKAQSIANTLLGGDQTHTCLVGGSRSGKTSLITRRIIKRALQTKVPSRHLIARLRANAVRASVLADTFPKIMRLSFPGVEWHKKQEGFVEFPENGSQIWFGGLDDAERIEKILGMEFATFFASECSQIPYSSILVLRTRLAQPGTGLRLKAYYDLNPTTKAHWTHVEFGEKRDPITRLLLDNPDDFDRYFINPMDNKENLDPGYLKSIASMPKAYRERFFEGKYVDAIEGALWTVDGLELCREDTIQPISGATKYKEFLRIAVGVDPSGAKSKLDRKSDEIGIVVVGKRRSGDAVVLEDLSCKGSPAEWGRAACAAFKKWRADILVAEANYGGGMVQGTIQAVDRNVPVKLVTATRGKVIRAEPVAALFDEGKITIAGRFNEMEDQMCNFSREGYLGDSSPDRADAMIWATSELMLGEQSTYTLANVR